MNNIFAITITAVDRATKTVNHIKNRLGYVVRPAVQLNQSFARLGNALGIKKLGENIDKLAVKAVKTTAAIGVSGGALYEMASSWANTGWELARTSQTLGISAVQLQNMRSAAMLAGLSGDALTGSMKSLGDTLEDALYGRNINALTTLNRLGVTIRRTKDGAPDVVQAYLDIADAIHKIGNPQAQAAVARMFGLEDMLPMLRMGSSAMKEYFERAARLNSQLDTGAAQRYGQSLAELTIRLQNLKNEMGADVYPAMSKGIQVFGEFISEHKKLSAAIGVGLPTAVLVASIARIGIALVGLASGPIGLVLGGLAAIVAAGYGIAKVAQAIGSKSNPNAPHPDEHWVAGTKGVGRAGASGHWENNERVAGASGPWWLRSAGPRASKSYEHWVADANGGHWEAGRANVMPTLSAAPSIATTPSAATPADVVDDSSITGKVSPALQARRDADRLRILQDELASAQRSGGNSEDVAALEREIGRTQQSIGGSDGGQTHRAVVEISFNNAPPGTRATVRNADPGVSVRMGQTMPALP